MPYLLPYWAAGGCYSPHLSGSRGSVSRGIRTVCRLAAVSGLLHCGFWISERPGSGSADFLATVGGWCVGGVRSLVIFAATHRCQLEIPRLYFHKDKYHLNFARMTKPRGPWPVTRGLDAANPFA